MFQIIVKLQDISQVISYNNRPYPWLFSQIYPLIKKIWLHVLSYTLYSPCPISMKLHNGKTSHEYHLIDFKNEGSCGQMAQWLKSTCSSCRGPKFSPQHPHVAQNICNSSSRDSDVLFSDAHGIHKNTHTHKVKILKAKNERSRKR